LNYESICKVTRAIVMVVSVDVVSGINLARFYRRPVLIRARVDSTRSYTPHPGYVKPNGEPHVQITYGYRVYQQEEDNHGWQFEVSRLS
jgi:hypothetical protein